MIDYPAIARLLADPSPEAMRGMSGDTLVEYDRLLTVTGGAPKPLRRWQGECLPRALCALESRQNGVIVATTGAGKSVLLAELIRRWRETHPESEGTIVVTTPSVQLVEQLGTTLAEWLGPGVVGRYYTKAKQWKRPVVVACNASVVTLSAVLAENGRGVAVWIADEMHKAVGAWAEADAVEGEDPADDVIADRLGAGRRIGLTATPFRSVEEQRISLFTEVVYRYSPADALRDGVIVPWRFVPWDDDEVEVDEACIPMILALGDRAARGPGVVNASDIGDAEEYALTLSAAGIEARPIHSRMPEGTRKANLAALFAGEIDCLVHVSMLVEGVDLPALRWGCLRRPVGARVRFIQELGRYLRAFPGKSEAIILDPNALESKFQITYEAALGWVEPAIEVPEPEPVDPMKEAPDKEPRSVLTARVHCLARYIRQLHQALIAEGVCEAAERRAGGWRNEEVSPKQAAALVGMVRVSARLGTDHRAALGKLAVSPVLTRGLASDAFDLLRALQKLKAGQRAWEPALTISIPPDHAFEAVVQSCFVGAALADGWAAVTVTMDGVRLFGAARPVKEGDTVEALRASGDKLARERYGAKDVRSAPLADDGARREIEGKRAPAMFGPQWARA